MDWRVVLKAIRCDLSGWLARVFFFSSPSFLPGRCAGKEKDLRERARGERWFRSRGEAARLGRRKGGREGRGGVEAEVDVDESDFGR